MEKSELIPILCEHITETTPYAGLPDNNNNPAYLCAQCFTSRVAKLVETMKPAAVFRLIYVEPQHVPAIVRAMQIFTIALKKSNPERSLVRNRVQCTARYLWNAAGLGHSKQERFTRYFNRDDNGPPSYRRHKIIMPITEPKSLSSYGRQGEYEAYNRREVSA
jgi:hypothetical protein